jgi:hypothetical protein
VSPAITSGIIGFYVVAPAALDKPDRDLALVTSFGPLTAPVSMVPRLALSDVSLSQPPVSTVLGVATTVLAARLPGRLDEDAFLQTRPRNRLRETWQREVAARPAATPAPTARRRPRTAPTALHGTSPTR